MRVDLRMATRTNHVRCLGSNWDDRCDYGRSCRLGDVGCIRACRGNAADGLCVTGGRRLGRYETVRWWSFLTHFGIGFPFWQLLLDCCPWLSTALYVQKNPLSTATQANPTLQNRNRRTFSKHTPTGKGQERTPDLAEEKFHFCPDAIFLLIY